MYDNLLMNFGFPLIDKITDIDIYSKYRKLKICQWRSKEELEKMSWKRLICILKYSYDNIPLYREKFDSVGITPADIKDREDMLKIPITTKDDFRKNYHNAISKMIPKNRYIYDGTSGSTGDPFRFIKDKNTLGIDIASNMIFSEWAYLKMGMRNVRIWGLHKNDIQTWLWEKFIRRRMTIDAFSIRDNNVDKYIQKILNYNPISILGYTSSLINISNYLNKSEKEFRFKNLRSIIVAGETLTEYERKNIEKNFHCKVFNLYGSREIMNIAQECEYHNGLHINTENVYLEIIKDNDDALYGDKGEIIVTDLNNFAMPFIRYNIGDIGIAKKDECSCGRGFPLLKRIEGRVTDFIKTPSGNTIPFLFFNYFFEQYGTSVRRFQVVQNRQDELSINICTTEKYNSSIGKHIKEELQKYMGNEIILDLNTVDEIFPEESGKTKVVKKNIYE